MPPLTGNTITSCCGAADGTNTPALTLVPFRPSWISLDVDRIRTENDAGPVPVGENVAVGQ